MDKCNYKPSLQICVSLIGQLEKAREYKAVFALYRYMIKQGYDFYENTFLNDVFKRLVSVTAKGIDAELKITSKDLKQLDINDISIVEVLAAAST